MLIALITIGLMVGTGFLMRNAKNKASIESYMLVLIGGIVTFLFEPAIITLYTDGSTDGGAIQLASTILGIYFIGWSIVRMVKFKKEKDTSVNISSEQKNT
jgi:predicted Na+-dependent transporter